jgi:hypothetical protein
MKDLLVSRRFWALVLGLLVIIVGVFYPGFDLNTEEAVGLVLVVSSYIIGVTVDPGPGGWRGVLMSRKFWAAVVGLAVLILRGFHIGLPFDLTAEQLTTFMVIIGSYIVGVTLDKFRPALTK